MAEKKTSIELGEFQVKAINEDGAEARLSNEKDQGGIILRKKSLNKQFQDGAIYTITATLNTPATEALMVDAKIPAGATGSLPAGSELIDSKP